MEEAGVMRTRVVAALLAASALAGCKSYLPVDADGARTALPPGQAAARLPAAYAPPPSQAAPSYSAAKPDRCGASDLAYLVGKPRTEIPVPTDPGRRQVVCTTCPRAPDVRTNRQTIVYDQGTGKVTGVTCG